MYLYYCNRIFFKFLKRVSSGKPSLAAIGDLSELPFADELKA